MQEINAEYDRLFKLLKDQHENNCSSDRTSTNNDYSSMKYDFAEDEKLREILNQDKLIKGYSNLSIVVFFINF